MSAWTQARINLLKRLWPEGRSAETIALELGGGLTRNAVLGKVARLGLSEGRTGARTRREAAHHVAPEPPPDGAVCEHSDPVQEAVPGLAPGKHSPPSIAVKMRKACGSMFNR